MVKKKVSHKKTAIRQTVTRQDRPRRSLKLVIYGPPGVGKTSLGACFPNPYFIVDDKEEGIYDLLEFGRVQEPLGIEEVSTFPNLLRAIDDSSQRKPQTLVIDSLTGMERLCFEHHCKEAFEDDWSDKGFMSFYRGPASAAKDPNAWPKFLSVIDDVTKFGIDVVLLAHSETKTVNNPEGADYDTYQPTVDARIWKVTHQWSQAVLFYKHRLELKGGKGDKEPTKTKAKVKESEGRIICTEYTPAYYAKNRMGLSPIIDAGESAQKAYDNLMEEINKNRKM